MNHETWLFGIKTATRKGDNVGTAKTGYGWICSCGHVEMKPYARKRADADAYTHQVTQHGSTEVPHLVGQASAARDAAEYHAVLVRRTP